MTNGGTSKTEFKAQAEAAGHSPETPLKVIRRHCIECSGGQLSEVRLCTVTRCPLYPFRMGFNPWSAERSEAQMASAERLGRGRHLPPKNQGAALENSEPATPELPVTREVA